MTRFYNFVNEAAIIKAISVVTDGLPKAVEIIDYLATVLHTAGGSAVTKWESKLDFICGKDPTTKQFFIATPTKTGHRYNYSIDDIKTHYNGDKLDTVKAAFSALRAFNINGIVGGKVVYVKHDFSKTKDKNSGTTYLNFGNYMVDANSDIGQKITRSNIGIVVNKELTGDNIRTIETKWKHGKIGDPSRNIVYLKPTREVVVFPNLEKNNSVFSKSESIKLKDGVTKLYKIYKKLNNSILNQFKASGIFQAMKNHESSVDISSISKKEFLKGFAEEVKKHNIQKVKAASKDTTKIKDQHAEMVNFINRHQDQIVDILEFDWIANDLLSMVEGKNIKTSGNISLVQKGTKILIVGGEK